MLQEKFLARKSINMLDVALDNTSLAQGSRFQSLLQGSCETSSSAPWDTVLYSDCDFVIAPTLGSLVPRWLLFIPKRPFLNFAQVATEYEYRPITTISSILSRQFNYDRNFVWFEHGAATTGSVAGCGVDHAHIHVILEPEFTFESLRLVVMSMSNHSWRTVTPVASYDNHRWQQEYLVFGDKETAFWADLATPPRSQFFRRAISEIVGRRTEWDYRCFPHGYFAEETVRFVVAQSKNKI